MHKDYRRGEIPQTTEILSFSRDNNIESKRHVFIWLENSNWRHRCPRLAIALIFQDWGRCNNGDCSFGRMLQRNCSGLYQFFRKFKYQHRNPASTAQIRDKRKHKFMFARLWSNSRVLKEVALKCLIDSGYKAENERKINWSTDLGYHRLTWNIQHSYLLQK